MAGTDLNDIYVDLSIDDYLCDVDKYGAPILSPSIEYIGTPGSKSTPLSLGMLRRYLRYRVDTSPTNNRNIFIRGYFNGHIDIPANESGILLYFKSREPNGCTWNISSWDNEPYKMRIGFRFANKSFPETPGTFIFIESENSNINISNLEIYPTTRIGVATDGTITTSNYGGLACQTPSEDEYNVNSISFINCRIYVDGYRVTPETYFTALRLYGYYNMNIHNSLIYSELQTVCDFTQDYYYPYNGSSDNIPRVNITNSIFFNIDWIYRSVSDHADIDPYTDIYVSNNVFSSSWDSLSTADYSQFGISPPLNSWYFIQPIVSYPESYNSNRFNYPVPTFSIESVITDGKSFYTYTNDNWNTIDMNCEGEIDNVYVYGRRDGIGPLYFPDLSDGTPNIFIDNRTPGIGSTIRLNILPNTYYNEYMPSKYVWYIDDDIIVDDDCSGITYTTNLYSGSNIGATIHSYHDWYYIDISNTINVDVDKSLIDFDIILRDDNGNEISELSVGNSVNITVINKTPIVYLVSSALLYIDSNIGIIVDSSREFSTEYNTTYIGTYKITLEVETVSGSIVYFYKTLNVVDVVDINKYYVDLSIDYDTESWLELDYGFTDYFDTGSISNRYNYQFIDNYNTTNMRGYSVATGTIPSLLFNGVGYGSFIFEWGFVRDNIEDIPIMTLKYNNININVKWDYLNHSIIVEHNGVIYKTIYGIFLLDYTCDGFLDMMSYKFEFFEDTEELILYYDIGGGWIYSGWSLPSFLYTNIEFIINTTTYTGLDYIKFQANVIDMVLLDIPTKGSEIYPLTFNDFYDRVMVNGVGEYGDVYLCRNSRTISNTTFQISPIKSFVIRDWDSMRYGVWMLMFNNMKSSVRMYGVLLYNGIISNTISGNYDLAISTTYDMFIVWNNMGRIMLLRYKNRYFKDDYRVDIVGSTIKSESGVYTGLSIRG